MLARERIISPSHVPCTHAQDGVKDEDKGVGEGGKMEKEKGYPPPPYT